MGGAKPLALTRPPGPGLAISVVTPHLNGQRVEPVPPQASPNNIQTGTVTFASRRAVELPPPQVTCDISTNTPSNPFRSPVTYIYHLRPPPGHTQTHAHRNTVTKVLVSWLTSTGSWRSCNVSGQNLFFVCECLHTLRRPSPTAPPPLPSSRSG